MPITSFKDLLVWQRSMELVQAIYLITSALPANEQFELSSQMRRAATSVPSNISEGYQRSSTKDYIRFLYIAYGSLGELDTQLGIVELQFISIDTLVARNLLTQTGKMLNTMIRNLKVPLENS